MKVLIVREGQWGQLKPEDYGPFMETLQEVLSQAERPGPNNTQNKAAEVEVVDTAIEAEKRVGSEGIGVVVFISRGMAATAKKMASKHPRTRVVIFTGLIPDGEVIWVKKGPGTGREVIENAVLN